MKNRLRLELEPLGELCLASDIGYTLMADLLPMKFAESAPSRVELRVVPEQKQDSKASAYSPNRNEFPPPRPAQTVTFQYTSNEQNNLDLLTIFASQGQPTLSTTSPVVTSQGLRITFSRSFRGSSVSGAMNNEFR